MGQEQEQETTVMAVVLKGTSPVKQLVTVWRNEGSTGGWVVSTRQGGMTTQRRATNPQMWQRQVLGVEYSEYAVIPQTDAERLMEGNLVKTAFDWITLEGVNYGTGLIEPTWLNTAIEAGSAPGGLTTTPKPKKKKKKGLTPAQKAKQTRTRLKSYPCPWISEEAEYHSSWLFPPDQETGLGGVTNVEFTQALVADDSVKAMLIWGDRGCGKSMLGMLVGGPGVRMMDFTTQSDRSEIIGMVSFDEAKGGLFHEWSPLVQAMKHRHDKDCVDNCGLARVVVNEIDYLIEAYATLLHPILDTNPSIDVVGEGIIEAGPDFMVIATMNAYGAQIPLALRSRLGRPIVQKTQWNVIKKLGVHPKFIEVAKDLHRQKETNNLFGDAPATRELLSITDMFEKAQKWMDEEQALMFAADGFMGSDVSEQDHKVVKDTIAGKLGFEPDTGGVGGRA